MRSIDCTTLYLPFLCRQLGYMPTCLAQCITCVDEAKPIAGVVFDNYRVTSISAHIWVHKEFLPCRDWYGAIFDYPFNRLGVKKILGQVTSNNKEAILLDTHLGFVEEGHITDYSDEGDLIILTMTREQCRVLNSPKWAKVTQKVARAV